MRRVLEVALLLLVVLSLPGLRERVAFDRRGPVTLVIDGRALRQEAREEGTDLLKLLAGYRALGVGGVAFYEEHVEDRVARGAGVLLEGGWLRTLAPAAGFQPGWYYTTVPGATVLPLPQHRVVWQDRTWVGFPTDVSKLPLGPPPELPAAYRMGYFIVYRPDNRWPRPWPPAVPAGVGAYVFVGDQALGWPDRLAETAKRLNAPVALIEGTPQKGILPLARAHGALRLFSLRAEYQRKLGPDRAAEKYLLAARERGHQLLYFRPFKTPEETRRFIWRIEAGLKASGIPLGPPAPKTYRPRWPRVFAWGAALAGFLLYLFALPPVLAIPTGLFLLLLAFGYGGDQAGPLLVGMVFPTLGFLRGGRGLLPWLFALLFALAGGVLIAELGSSWASLLGLTAFRGVAFLLVFPPLLYLLARLPRTGWTETLRALYDHRLRLGEAALAGLLLLALAVALIRRGNDAPFVPGVELLLREKLQAVMIRPRFKELFGHTLGVFALLAPLPTWLQNALLAGATLAEASMLDSFAHYHTPFWISLVRGFNGAFIGFILGLIATWLYRGVRRWWWA